MEEKAKNFEVTVRLSDTGAFNCLLATLRKVYEMTTDETIKKYIEDEVDSVLSSLNKDESVS